MNTANSHRPPRVWVVSELYYPEETSTGYFLTGIAEGLAGREFSVSLDRQRNDDGQSCLLSGTGQANGLFRIIHRDGRDQIGGGSGECLDLLPVVGLGLVD